MKLAMVGLGKMGGNMTLRLLKDQHEVVVYDRDPEVTQKIAEKGAIAANDMADLCNKLPERKIVWLMVPAGKVVDSVIESLLPYLNKDDIIVDGGNSNWHDSKARAEKLAEKGIYFIDCGTSGGV